MREDEQTPVGAFPSLVTRLLLVVLAAALCYFTWEAFSSSSAVNNTEVIPASTTESIQ